jgi:hypothetical protein
MLAKRLIKSNDAGGGACTNTVDLYNPFPDGGGVALYQLNGDATDVSGNYNGTASNLNYVAGQFGQGASFNTSNSILTTPRAFSTNAPYSVSGWVKIANGSTTQAARLFWQITGTNQTAVQVNYNGVDSYVFGVTHKFETNGGFSHSFAANDGQWHHYAMTFNGSSANLYIDGSFVKSGLLDPKGDVSSTNYLGGTNIYNGITYYNGLDGIDQVRYFNRALRPYEVEALYTEEYCTPTIVPSEHFNTVLWTGNLGSTQAVTGVGFEPEMIWLKNRDADASGGSNHHIMDVVRGVDNFLYPNLTIAETLNTGAIESVDLDGFTVSNSTRFNNTGKRYAAWNFKAGGAAVTNTDGTITSQVSANTEAGFSIVTWTGGFNGDTIGHGLDNAPDFVIVKARSATSGWVVYHKSLLSGQILELQNTDAAKSEINIVTNNTTISASWTSTSLDWVSYCFAEVEGFSNFGSYVGTGAAGNTIVTGFEPAFVMLKRTDIAGYSWAIADNKRVDGELLANSSDAERIENTPDFLENGFRLTTERYNDSGSKWIYMAFAADPTAVEPTLEDSFNTVLYTGTNSSLPITGVGFQPDLVWIKNRTGSVDHHSWIDSVRGKNSQLFSNLTNGENTFTDQLDSFDSDGFTVGTGFIGSEAGRLTNVSGNNYVAWAWKGAEIPAINSNGSIPSVVSANPAAGFSIVSYTGNGSTGTIGHGLSSAPSMLIIKNRSLSTNWVVGSNEIGWNYSLNLNDTSAAGLSTNRFNATSPTSSVFSVGATSVSNGSGNSMIAYCFAEVAGFSKFGSYVGNANVNGATITTGFEPAFVMVKQSDFTNSWLIYDNKRNPSNSRDKRIFANSSAGEFTDANQAIDFNPSGFQIIGTDSGHNRLNGTFIYMAFANQF